MLLRNLLPMLHCHLVATALTSIKEPSAYRHFIKLYDFIDSNFQGRHNILAVTGIFGHETFGMLDWTLANYGTTPTIVTALDRKYKPPTYPLKANIIVVVLKNATFVSVALDLLVKRENMYGHVIHGGTVDDIPRAVYRNGQFYVAEKVIMVSIIRRMNATVKETYYVNHTHAKLLDEIMNDNLDCTFLMVFVQRFGDLDPQGKLQFSYPYNMDATAIIMPRPDYIPTYLNIFFIFQHKLWICLIVTCVLVTLSNSFLDRVASTIVPTRMNESAMFQTLRIMINLPSTEIKRAMFSKKLFFLFCIWLAFFVSALFHSSLTSSLIKPKRYDTIKTLKQLSESNYMIYMFAKQRVENSSSWEMLKNHYVFVNKTQIFRMVMAGNYEHGYGCNSLESADILIRRSRNKVRKGRFYILNEAVVPGHRGFLFPKSSPYFSTINKYLLLYKEFGIQRNKYGSLEAERNLIPEKDKLSSNRVAKEVALSLVHVQTSFYILFLGLMGSVVVFVSEMLFDRYLKNRK
ncbi:hypothetical protein FQR65_LT03539 [Abscondita terminalis]|nr:hypothetical protein FQR65_LT03539 [Abscondita terminalis]